MTAQYRKQLGIFKVGLLVLFVLCGTYAGGQTAPAFNPFTGQAGGGGGVTGLTSCGGGTALADNGVMRADGTTGCQGSDLTISDLSGDAVTLATASGSQISIRSGASNDLKLLPNNSDNSGWTFHSGGDFSQSAAAASSTYVIGSAASSSTVPLYVFRGDTTTGLGRAGAGQASLIAAGVESARATTTTVQALLSFTATPQASPPFACGGGTEGGIYADTSHALCFCDGTSWNVLTGSGAGSCA